MGVNGLQFLHMYSYCSNTLLLQYHLSVDIDECGTNNGGCPEDMMCINTQGSYECDCRPGLTLDSDGVTCTGWFLKNCFHLNECAT